MICVKRESHWRVEKFGGRGKDVRNDVRRGKKKRREREISDSVKWRFHVLHEHNTWFREEPGRTVKGYENS